MVRADHHDVAVVGGGPAGLASAIAAAMRGLSVVVLEQRAFPPDKACGEGLLPPGVFALEHLGVLRHLDPADRYGFHGIRFLQEDGSSAEAPLGGRGGLGVRRTALVGALARRAAELDVDVRPHCRVERIERDSKEARLHSSDGLLTAEIVIAADGLHSPLRRACGLDGPPGRRRRYALRRHWRIRPWTSFVEVYVDKLGEAFVTPVGEAAINVNFVWERGQIEHPTIESLARRFPSLAARLAAAETISEVRGAGPMACSARRRTIDRLVLIGDAAGFVDSISGDGLSVAFNSSIVLARHLPNALARRATAASLADYERSARGLFRSYWAVTNGLLWIARHPRFRTNLIHLLGRHPAIAEAMMGGAMKLMLSAAPS